MTSTKRIEEIVTINYLIMDTKKNNQYTSHDENSYAQKQL